MLTCDRCGVVIPPKNHGGQGWRFHEVGEYGGRLDACLPCFDELYRGDEQVQEDLKKLKIERLAAWFEEWKSNKPLEAKEEAA